MKKRFAAVDIGSNTIKVTISDYLDNQFEKILYKDFSSCLSHTSSVRDEIDPAALKDCYIVMNEIKKILQKNKVDNVNYIATHALRAAANQNEILDLFQSNTGVNIKVISGEEEAKLTLTGILIDQVDSSCYACINAGGGSTELSFYIPESSKREVLYFFPFGAVNLFSNYFKDQPNVETAINKIDGLIQKEFKKVNISLLPQIDKVISVGGSIYNAAYIFNKDTHRNFNELRDMKLSLADLESVINQLKVADEQERLKMTGLDHKRIYTILPGILIHYFLLKLLKKRELFISNRTISDGLIYNMALGK